MKSVLMPNEWLETRSQLFAAAGREIVPESRRFPDCGESFMKEMTSVREEKRANFYGWLRVGLAVMAALVLSGAASAQYTDTQAIADLGGAKAFEARRAELAKQCKTGWILLFARNEIPEATHYREDNDFYYYTGLQDPGAAMAIESATGKTYIFETQQDPRTAQVYGPNLW